MAPTAQHHTTLPPLPASWLRGPGGRDAGADLRREDPGQPYDRNLAGVLDVPAERTRARGQRVDALVQLTRGVGGACKEWECKL